MISQQRAHRPENLQLKLHWRSALGVGVTLLDVGHSAAAKCGMLRLCDAFDLCSQRNRVQPKPEKIAVHTNIDYSGRV